MASHTHAHVRAVRSRRPAPEGISTRPLPREAARPEDRPWPTDIQVWNWAESAVLFGYGPSASNFL
ncbi:hypothetical protein ACIBL6_22865 [Streptomyces sp. NPDC050400]|uniref:hypothetical protein n=1 Tax=Streptomyces sp. NPDC050400 TaxID=3365610 RepID=UPI00379B44C8